jgi:hypothetical protein
MGPQEIDGYLRGLFEQFRDYRIEVRHLEQLSEETRDDSAEPAARAESRSRMPSASSFDSPPGG